MKQFNLILATIFVALPLLGAHSHETSVSKTTKAQSSTRLSNRTTKMTPRIAVRNQALVNSTIVISSFTLDKTGWLMSHLQGKGGKPGTMAGVTGPFAPGTYRNVRIKLWGNIKAGDKVWPMLHYDNGKKPGIFEGHDDHHVDVNGKTVTKQITITSVKGAKPQTGNYIVMPPSRMTSVAR